MRRNGVLSAGNTNKNPQIQKTGEKREVEKKWNLGKSPKMMINSRNLDPGCLSSRKGDVWVLLFSLLFLQDYLQKLILMKIKNNSAFSF